MNFPSRAFSLIETVIAVGLIAFAVVAIIATLPLGLNSVLRANEENVAAAALKTLQARLLAAPALPDGPDRWRQTIPGIQGASWQIGGATYGPETIRLGAGGHECTQDDDGAVIARVIVTPPRDIYSHGTARIQIAWPADSTWDGARWRGERGSLETTLYFVPRLDSM